MENKDRFLDNIVKITKKGALNKNERLGNFNSTNVAKINYAANELKFRKIKKCLKKSKDPGKEIENLLDLEPALCKWVDTMYKKYGDDFNTMLLFKLSG